MLASGQPMPVRAALLAAAKWGAQAVELDARNQIHPSQLSDTGLRQLRKMLDDLNLRVSSLRFPTRHGYDVLDGLDRRVEATKSAMKLAYRLGTRNVTNSLGTLPGEDDPGRQTLVQVIDDLGRYGAHVGAFLTAETGAESGAELESFLKLCDQGHISAALNPGQLIIQRHSVDDAIAALKGRVELVYAVDGVIDLAAGRGIQVPLGQGIADFPAIMGRLEEFQYRGDFVVGRPGNTAREIDESLSYLRAIHG